MHTYTAIGGPPNETQARLQNHLQWGILVLQAHTHQVAFCKRIPYRKQRQLTNLYYVMAKGIPHRYEVNLLNCIVYMYYIVSWDPKRAFT